MDEDKDLGDLKDCPTGEGWYPQGTCTEDNTFPLSDQYIILCARGDGMFRSASNSDAEMELAHQNEKLQKKNARLMKAIEARVGETRVGGWVSGAGTADHMYCGRNKCRTDITDCVDAFAKMDDDKDLDDLKDCPTGEGWY